MNVIDIDRAQQLEDLKQRCNDYQAELKVAYARETSLLSALNASGKETTRVRNDNALLENQLFNAQAVIRKGGLV